MRAFASTKEGPRGSGLEEVDEEGQQLQGSPEKQLTIAAIVLSIFYLRKCNAVEEFQACFKMFQAVLSSSKQLQDSSL